LKLKVDLAPLEVVLKDDCSISVLDNLIDKAVDNMTATDRLLILMLGNLKHSVDNIASRIDDLEKS
jgi:hypothetical protein